MCHLKGCSLKITFITEECSGLRYQFSGRKFIHSDLKKFEIFQTVTLNRILCDWIINFTPIISSLSYNHLICQCKKLISAPIREDGSSQSIIHCETLLPYSYWPGPLTYFFHIFVVEIAGKWNRYVMVGNIFYVRHA